MLIWSEKSDPQFYFLRKGREEWFEKTFGNTFVCPLVKVCIDSKPKKTFCIKHCIDNHFKKLFGSVIPGKNPFVSNDRVLFSQNRLCFASWLEFGKFWPQDEHLFCVRQSACILLWRHKLLNCKKREWFELIIFYSIFF